MKLIKIIGKVLYILIIFIIIIYGIIGIGEVLKFIGITGFLNSLLQYSLSIYGIGMFYYDINKVYNKNGENK